MAQNRLVIFMSTVPNSVIELNSRFNAGIFNKDRTKRQLDGYHVDENEDYILPKRLCHDENYLLYLCRGEDDPVKCVQEILDSSYELKVTEHNIMKKDKNSEWYDSSIEMA